MPYQLQNTNKSRDLFWNSLRSVVFLRLHSEYDLFLLRDVQLQDQRFLFCDRGVFLLCCVFETVNVDHHMGMGKKSIRFRVEFVVLSKSAQFFPECARARNVRSRPRESLAFL